MTSTGKWTIIMAFVKPFSLVDRVIEISVKTHL